MYQELDILDGEVYARLLCDVLGQVDCGERGVEGEVEDLKAALGCVGRARPEVAQSWRLLSRLRDVARVEGYRPEVAVSTGGQSRVEGHPVEPLLEVLPEAALARHAEPRHLAEVDASGYGKVADHGLGEERFERIV